MKAEFFTQKMKQIGIETLIGVPDSTLKQFCDYINTDGASEFHHYVPENEGSAIGIAAGVYLATKKPACVYMQNSGLGNTVNPITSLLNREVYDIPVLMLVGWRGEPGVHDEPQHKFMGKITEDLLKVLEIPHAVISKDTTPDQLDSIFEEASETLQNKKQYAIVIKKNTFDARESQKYQNQNHLGREVSIARILASLRSDDVVVSTTGKISREVYEQSDKVLHQHAQEFLTVGGMGHASMIAFGIAENMPDRRVFCIDGDGAVLMHLGSLPFIGKQSPENFFHICLNNEAHESVGGMPTGAVGQSYASIAQQSGYKHTVVLEDEASLEQFLSGLDHLTGPVFAEIKVSMDSRSDLGRPKETAAENKEAFMKYHGVI